MLGIIPEIWHIGYPSIWDLKRNKRKTDVPYQKITHEQFWIRKNERDYLASFKVLEGGDLIWNG